MSTAVTPSLPELGAVVEQTIAPSAAEVDRAGVFPRADIDALARAGTLGAAFRKELGIERRYRDAIAARVMAPTTEALHDFVGRATLGLPLSGGA